MYIFRSDNRLEVPITLHSFKGMAEEVTLIDSGATENFIDQETVKKLKLGSKKLSEPVRLRNIDGTYNQSGSVTHFINLLVNRGGRKIMQRFYVTNLGSDRIILGYPWLRAFNPDVDWPNCKLIGPKVKMETMLHARNPRLREMLANKWGVLNSTIPIQDKPDQVDLVVRRTEIAETLNNGHNEEDLLLESAMREEASQQAAEANTSYGETVMEARKTVVNDLSPPLRLDEPNPKKSIKDYVPEHYCHGLVAATGYSGVHFPYQTAASSFSINDLISSPLPIVVARYFLTLPVPSPSFLPLPSSSGTFHSRFLYIPLLSGSFCMLPPCFG